MSFDNCRHKIYS